MIQPPFPLSIGSQPRLIRFLTTKTAVRKNEENNSQTRPPCLDMPVLAQGGGGCLCVEVVPFFRHNILSLFIARLIHDAVCLIHYLNYFF